MKSYTDIEQTKKLAETLPNAKNDTIVSTTIEVKLDVVLPPKSQVNDYEAFLEMAKSELTEYAKTLYYGKIKTLK